MEKQIEIEMSIQRFKKGEKRKADYGFPEAIYVGSALLTEQDKAFNVTFEGKRGNLPVRLFWQRDGKIFCVATRPRKKVRFVLHTKLNSGENIGSFNVGGQDARTGKYVNWSACLEVRERK